VVASCANQFPTFAIVFSVFEAARGILEERFPKQSKQTIDTAAVLAGRLGPIPNQHLPAVGDDHPHLTSFVMA